MTSRRLILVIALLNVFLVLPGFSAPVSAGPGGNAAAAHACQGEGFRNYDRGDGQPFANVGQCVRAATRGPLVPMGGAPLPAPDLQIFGGLGSSSPWDGYVTGSGFTPGSTITSLTGVSLPSGTVHDFYPTGITPSRVDEDGDFVTTHTGYWFCTIGGTTAMRMTAVASDGITYSETFRLACPARGK